MFGLLEDEKLQNERVLQQCRVENIDFQAVPTLAYWNQKFI